VSNWKSILVVCDDELVCQFTELRLKRLGYGSTVVPSAEAGRSVFQHNSEKFDLVMVDYNLLDGNGVDLASEFLDIRPDVPIVLYTGGSLRAEDVRSNGIRAVIPKVLTMKEFADALRSVLT
jgi:DNA-binding response OmpR family regulator